MRNDEYNLLVGHISFADLHPKRANYLTRKWIGKGWLLDGELTDEYYRIQHIALNLWSQLGQLDGHVVTIVYKNQPTTVGILEEHGDYGYYFYSKRCQWHIAYADIAYIEQYPHPAKLWRKLNYIYWKRTDIPDRFHQKIHIMSSGTICNYEVVDNQFQFNYHHPLGKIGDCFPWCQCKLLE